MRNLKRTFTIVLFLLLIICLAGCARLRSGIHDLHGSIIGNEYYIDVFDKDIKLCHHDYDRREAADLLRRYLYLL